VSRRRCTAARSSSSFVCRVCTSVCASAFVQRPAICIALYIVPVLARIQQVPVNVSFPIPTAKLFRLGLYVPIGRWLGEQRSGRSSVFCSRCKEREISCSEKATACPAHVRGMFPLIDFCVPLHVRSNHCITRLTTLVQ
jgi:hypothetical protein